MVKSFDPALMNTPKFPAAPSLRNMSPPSASNMMSPDASMLKSPVLVIVGVSIEVDAVNTPVTSTASAIVIFVESELSKVVPFTLRALINTSPVPLGCIERSALDPFDEIVFVTKEVAVIAPDTPNAPVRLVFAASSIVPVPCVLIVRLPSDVSDDKVSVLVVVASIKVKLASFAVNFAPVPLMVTFCPVAASKVIPPEVADRVFPSSLKLSTFN